MKLTREERARILDGDHAALKRDDKPDCAEGEHYTLIWSRATTVVADQSTGETVSYPRRPLVWLEFAEPTWRRGGGWLLPFKFHDARMRTRFLGPAAAPTDEDALTEEGERGYRGSATGAIDHLEAVDDDELHRQQTKADARFAEHQEQEAAEERTRRQERALREKLKELVRQLPPEAGQALLARVQRELELWDEEARD